MNTKFTHSSLVSVHRMICSDTRCVLSSPWLGTWACACPSLCVKSHRFHLVALHMCPAHTDSATGVHEHRSHRAQGIQPCIIGTGQKCHSMGHLLAFGTAMNENHWQVMKVPQHEGTTSSWKGQQPIFHGKGHVRWAQRAPCPLHSGLPGGISTALCWPAFWWQTAASRW